MKTKRFLEILTAFPGRRVLVVGDVMLDEYICGQVRRISPEAPVPVVESGSRTYVPGGAGNTAANVVGLGGEARLGGIIGDDPQGASLLNALSRAGVNSNGLLVIHGRPTTTKTRILAHNQQIVRVDSEQRGSLPTSHENTLLEWIDDQIEEVDACILSDYAKGVVSGRLAKHLIARARRAGKPIVVDPKGPNCHTYRGATILKPNIHEAERLAKHEITGEESLLAAGRRLADQFAGGALLLTRGSEGMSLFRQGLAPLHIPSVARDVFDVTGAGDTVVSTLAMALATGASLDFAAHLANIAAGFVVSKVGTTILTLEELHCAAGAPLHHIGTQAVGVNSNGRACGPLATQRSRRRGQPT